MLTVTYGYKNFQTKTIAFYKTDLAATQTSIIQDALNTVSGHAGGFVKLSAGTFTVVGRGKSRDGALRIGSSTVLMGAAMAETTITLATGSVGVTGILSTDFGGGNDNASAVTASNVRIECLTINGNSSGTFGEADGFCFGMPSKTRAQDCMIWLDRVAVTNVTRNGLDAHKGSPHLTITNCALGRSDIGFAKDGGRPDAVAAPPPATRDQIEFRAAAAPAAVRFQDNSTAENYQTGIVVQTRDNRKLAPVAGCHNRAQAVIAPDWDRKPRLARLPPPQNIAG